MNFPSTISNQYSKNKNFKQQNALKNFQEYYITQSQLNPSHIESNKVKIHKIIEYNLNILGPISKIEKTLKQEIVPKGKNNYHTIFHNELQRDQNAFHRKGSRFCIKGRNN